MDPIAPATSRSSLWFKFIECLLVAIAICDFYDSMVMYPLLLITFRDVHAAGLILNLINVVLIVLGLAFTIFYPLFWHRKEKQQLTPSGIRHAWFIGIIRYWLAIEICNYAFAKILGTQFGRDYFRENSVVRDLSGFDLTWYYFGYSYTLSLIVALMQIGGSVLLLFRRTVLIGVAILLPVMVNIILIDVFYQVQFGATMNAILFTVGLLFLLSLYFRELKQLFSGTRTKLPAASSSRLKHFLRLFLLVYAFLYIYYFTTTRSPGFLHCKWNVTQLIRNGDTAKVNDWLTDSTSWKNIYLEQFGRITLNPNPYVIEAARCQHGMYQYDGSRHRIHIELYGRDKMDTLTFDLVNRDGPNMKWVSANGKNDTMIQLIRSE